ncbi:MAG: sensor histidine kinase [Bacteroidota bacterium]
MANGYYRAKDFKNAYKYIERTYQTQIEQITNGNSKALLELETQYQTSQKEKEILQQRNDILELETANAAVVKQRNYWIGGTLLLAMLTFFTYLLNKARRERNDKMAFAKALLFAQEEERKRIAHDLHDGVGQSLLLIKKQIESNHLVTAKNRNMIAETLEEVRSMSRDLHPFQIEKFGLTDSIQDMIGKVEKSTDLFITQEIANIDDALPGKQQIHVYRAIQEALNNVIKHADATAAKVQIERFSKIILITVLDNGKGFDHELAVARSKSLGLRTMSERITNIGGTLKITPYSPKGTKVEMQIPV